jgi:hypothetical protein
MRRLTNRIYRNAAKNTVSGAFSPVPGLGADIELS